MTMKQFFIFLVLSVYLMAGWGCSSKQNDSQQSSTATIKVGSVVCGMCAKSVEEAIGQVTGVEEAKVDIETKTVTVRFLPVSTDLNAIESSIVKAGYDANEKRRDEKAYEKLDACCKVDG